MHVSRLCLRQSVSSHGRGTSSCRLEGPDEAVQAQVNSFREERDQGHSTNAHSGSCRVRQLDARSSVGAPECDEFGRPTSCGGSQHEIGPRCITDGLPDRWNDDVKAKPRVASSPVRLDRSMGWRSRQSRSHEASQDPEVACTAMGLGQRFGTLSRELTLAYHPTCRCVGARFARSSDDASRSRR